MIAEIEFDLPEEHISDTRIYAYVGVTLRPHSHAVLECPRWAPKRMWLRFAWRSIPLQYKVYCGIENGIGIFRTQ